MKNTDTMFQKIVAAQSMGICVESSIRNSLVLKAPLKLNSNDKGTFFAGSIYSTMVLSGWGLVTLLLQDNGIDAEVVVATSTIDYSKPATGDVQTVAQLGDESTLQTLLDSISSKGRGKIEVNSVLTSEGVTCAEFTGLYIAKAV